MALAKPSADRQEPEQGRISGPEATRKALIDAALELFGTNGFEATSTREIARRAGANIASIAYHFGGKGGLRQACADAVRSLIGEMVGSAFARSNPVVTASAEPETAAHVLEAIMRHVVRTALLSPQAVRFVPFVLREINGNSPVLDSLYRELMEPTHRRLCALWGAATGAEPESAAVRLAVFAMVGQMIYFRIGSQIVTRRMGWQEYSSAEVEQIADTVCTNLRAALQAGRTNHTGKERR